MTMYALQMDEEVAMHTLFRCKHGLNAAVHAAAQQTNEVKLAGGIRSIDPIKARATANMYLQGNLRLDPNNVPLSGTFFQSNIEVLVFEVINEEHAFPYTYVNELYNYNVTLEHPGVVMFVQLQYPRIYKLLQPITWTVKSSAEMVF
jgi:hypothetical protein